MAIRDSRQFVESFHDGDAVAAIFEIARAHGIGVHVVTVDDVAEAADRDVDDLSVEEREEVGQALVGFDEWLGNSGAQESLAEYRFQIAQQCALSEVEDEGAAVAG